MRITVRIGSILIAAAAFVSCGAPLPAPAVSPLQSPADRVPDALALQGATPIIQRTGPWDAPKLFVVGYRSSNGGDGFVIVDSLNRTLLDQSLPVSELAEDVVFAGMESGSRAVGLISKRSDGLTYYARVFWVDWGRLVPIESPSQNFVSSQYYPPLLMDLDEDTVPEVISSFDDPELPREYLGNRVYVLQEGIFTVSDFLLLPPRNRP